jgi:hypothetical protein
MSNQPPISDYVHARRRKVIGFLITEAVALGVLLLAGVFAILWKSADPTLALSVNVVTITAAVAVAIIPIVFFAMAPVLPRREG